MSERTTSATWVRGIVDALSTTGLDMPALCAEVGVAWGAAAEAGTACPTEKISLLWQRAVVRSANPSIAFLAARSVRPAIFGEVGYAMMSSADLLASLERLVQYLRILSDAATVTVAVHGPEVAVTLALDGGAVPVPRQRVEFDLLTMLAFGCWVLGRTLRPLAVELAHEAPPDVQPSLRAFQCMPRFDAPHNTVRLALADLQSPLPTGHPQLAALHAQFAGAQIEALDPQPPSHGQRARALIAAGLPGGAPGRTAIARELCLTERTLQRRLRAEGLSFHALVDDTRREGAVRYLVQAQLSLDEVAYRLGFASQGNFTRACHRWFAMTPGQYRARAAPPSPAADCGP